ncbi:NAD dependent epimerase/dehydratase [Phyllosticta citrichinensis]|uniref:NAD dependent epimerase/dehydratase n=1 Tax=Phyllosticta citrichinensis TaxID=1130410 RepID=A0ABR1XYW1_9PEZI
MARPSSPPKILLTGATGYVGGSVLHRLFKHPSLASIVSPSNPITLPVRPGGGDRIPKLVENKTYGPRVNPIAMTSLDDVQAMKALAAEHDMVINAGTGFHPASAEALVRGLAARKAATGQPAVWMIHTSGCSNISDKPITGAARPDVEYDDADSAAVFAFDVAENEREWYAQRAAELVVLRLGEELGVSAISIQAPCVFGTGEGLFRQAGLMIPVMMASVLQQGYGVTAGDGAGDIDYVHIADLAGLYVLCMLNIVEHGGSSLGTGRHGIIFPTAGRTLTRDIAQRCLDVAFAAGHLPKEGGPQIKEIRTLSLEESAAMTAGNLYIAETGLAGHCKTKGTVARTRLGWKPVCLEDAWKDGDESCVGWEEGKYL